LAKILVPELETLDLGSEVVISESSIRRIYTKCRDLSSLKLTDCVSLTDHQLTPLCKHLKKLRCLELRSCKYVTNVGISLISKSWATSSLKSLLIVDSPQITTEGLELLFQIPNLSLESIVIAQCQSVQPTQKELDSYKSKIKHFVFQRYVVAPQMNSSMNTENTRKKKGKR